MLILLCIYCDILRNGEPPPSGDVARESALRHLPPPGDVAPPHCDVAQLPALTRHRNATPLLTRATGKSERKKSRLSSKPELVCDQ